MFKEKGIQLLTNFSESVSDWQAFIKMIRKNAEKDDPNIIKMKVFFNILENYKIKVDEKEKEIIL